MIKLCTAEEEGICVSKRISGKPMKKMGFDGTENTFFSTPVGNEELGQRSDVHHLAIR